MLYTGPWNAQDDWELGQAWKRWSDAWDERQAEIQAERNAWRRAQRLEQELNDLMRAHEAWMEAYATLKKRNEMAEKRAEMAEAWARAAEDRAMAVEERLGETIASMIDYANEALDQTASKNVLRKLISKYADDPTLEAIRGDFRGDAFKPMFKAEREKIIQENRMYLDAITEPRTKSDESYVLNIRRAGKVGESESDFRQRTMMRDEHYSGERMLHDSKMR